MKEGKKEEEDGEMLLWCEEKERSRSLTQKVIDLLI
jgi:hypothetical protein